MLLVKFIPDWICYVSVMENRQQNVSIKAEQSSLNVFVFGLQNNFKTTSIHSLIILFLTRVWLIEFFVISSKTVSVVAEGISFSRPMYVELLAGSITTLW